MVAIKFNDFVKSTEFYQSREMKLNYKIGEKKFEEKNGIINI